MDPVERIERAHMRTDIPDIRPGDTVRVYSKFREGGKERVQPVEGVVIRIHRGQSRGTFTVRKVSYGTGVERIFPLHSPNLVKVDVLKRSRVRRSRLFYLRRLSGKAARLKEIRQAAPKKTT